MKQGEIWLINLDPTVGAEIAKKRPGLILNADGVGKLPLRIVAPITNWKPQYQVVPWMVELPSNDETGLDKPSSVDCFQARSISEKRMIHRLGEVPVEAMDRARHGLAVVLGLDR